MRAHKWQWHAHV